MSKTKWKPKHPSFYFTGEGRKDFLPLLAAFGNLSKSRGDEFTANYMTLIRINCKRLAQKNKRRQRFAWSDVEL